MAGWLVKYTKFKSFKSFWKTPYMHIIPWNSLNLELCNWNEAACAGKCLFIEGNIKCTLFISKRLCHWDKWKWSMTSMSFAVVWWASLICSYQMVELLDTYCISLVGKFIGSGSKYSDLWWLFILALVMTVQMVGNLTCVLVWILNRMKNIRQTQQY
jgi:hypothetical protein